MNSKSFMIFCMSFVPSPAKDRKKLCVCLESFLGLITIGRNIVSHISNCVTHDHTLSHTSEHKFHCFGEQV